MVHVIPIQPGITIPVRDAKGNKLPLDIIGWYVKQMFDQARRNPHQTYRVMHGGWGYKDGAVAPLFDFAPRNVYLAYEFIYPEPVK